MSNHTASPSDFSAGVIDEFRRSGGKVGGPFEGASMVLLHHTGAKSGSHRVTPLVYFPQHDGSMLVVASKAGAPDNPAWLHNLRANPDTEVEVGTDTVAVTAQVVDANERDTLWSEIVAEMPGFADYQRRTERVIPLVRLTPH